MSPINCTKDFVLSFHRRHTMKTFSKREIVLIITQIKVSNVFANVQREWSFIYLVEWRKVDREMIEANWDVGQWVAPQMG